jgi:large subunit ribosomal protein L15
MELHSITKGKRTEKKTRVGRGGKRGKTAGRGTKGQKARAGNKRRPEWRDIIKKLPKRRGYGKNRADTAVPKGAQRAINLDALSKTFKDNDVVSMTTLMRSGLVSRSAGKVPSVKILGNGELTKKLKIEGIALSASAKEAIEKKGGTVVS